MFKHFILNLLLICVRALSNNAWAMEKTLMFEVESYSGDAIIPHTPLLEEWVKRDYINYPYLWVPTTVDFWFDIFIKEENALVTIVKQQGEVVGVAAGISFDSEPLQNYFQEPLSKLAEECGFNPSQIVYMSFFLTAPQRRNDTLLVQAIYDTYVKFASNLRKTKISYWAHMSSEENHPLKPKKLVPVEPWGEVIHGFRSMKIKLNLPWMTLQSDGSVKEEIHPAEFFIKDL